MHQETSMSEIIIAEPITEELARSICFGMWSAWSYYHFDEITLRLSSPGGELLGMERVLREIDRCLLEGMVVRTVCDGPVASAAAVIASAGSPGYREAWPHARLLYHEPRYMAGTGMHHTAGGLNSLASTLGRSTDQMLERLLGRVSTADPVTDSGLRADDLPTHVRNQLQRSSGNGEEWSLREAYTQLLRLDMWLTPEEACALRLLDRCRPDPTLDVSPPLRGEIVRPVPSPVSHTAGS